MIGQHLFLTLLVIANLELSFQILLLQTYLILSCRTTFATKPASNAIIVLFLNSVSRCPVILRFAHYHSFSQVIHSLEEA